MKLLSRLLLILVFTYVLSLYLPWWCIIAISFVISYLIPGSYFKVFISGFLGGGMVWLLYAWYLDLRTDSILSGKIVGLFPVDDPLYLIIMTGLFGSLCAGLGAMAGNSFRLLFLKKKEKSLYS